MGGRGMVWEGLMREVPWGRGIWCGKGYDVGGAMMWEESRGGRSHEWEGTVTVMTPGKPLPPPLT